MKPNINLNKIVIFTGAGVSAESGIQTFRDTGGLWNEYRVEDVATPEAWLVNPELVLNFYNERRKKAAEAPPNSAHYSIAELEKKFEVVVITQNVDDLHERAGSSNVIHVHGQLNFARSSVDESLLYRINDSTINIGDLCEKGSQLRPHVVWFGEKIQNYEESKNHLLTASRFLVVGTSLSVYPAANLLKKARFNAEKIIITKELERRPGGFRLLRGNASSLVPSVVSDWIAGRKAA